MVENNLYAFSTPIRNQYACERLSDRAVGYGLAGETVDGNDPEAMAAAYARAVARARRGDGPTLIEAMLGRMRGHAEGDDSLKVVPKEDHAQYLANDPVPAYARRLEEDGVLDTDMRQRLEAQVRRLVEESLDRALDAPAPAAEVATRSVFAAAWSGPAMPPVPVAALATVSVDEDAGPAAMTAFTGAADMASGPAKPPTSRPWQRRPLPRRWSATAPSS